MSDKLREAIDALRPFAQIDLTSSSIPADFAFHVLRARAVIANAELAGYVLDKKCRNWLIKNDTAWPRSCPTCGLSKHCPKGIQFEGFPT